MEVVLEDTYATDYYDLAYPGLIMKIFLTREIGYHIVQTYIPSIVFVMLAWLSLMISPESVPGEDFLQFYNFNLKGNARLIGMYEYLYEE